MRILSLILLLGTQVFINPKTSATTITGGTCTNQAVTALSSSGVPTCTTLTSSYTSGLATLTGNETLTNKLVQIPSTVVGSLGTCNAGARGQIKLVTDALVPVALATVAAGGAVVVPVLCDGSNWIVF